MLHHILFKSVFIFGKTIENIRPMAIEYHLSTCGCSGLKPKTRPSAEMLLEALQTVCPES